MSAADFAQNTLERFEIKATFYLSSGLLGNPSAVGDIVSKEKVLQLSNSGHEIGCHTYLHENAWKLNHRAYVNSAKENKRKIEVLLGGRTVKSFSYPFGSCNLRVKSQIGRIYESARSIVGDINHGIMDLAFLKAVDLFSSTDFDHKLHFISKIVSENVRKKGFLVFYTHDISKHPSPFGTHPAFLFKVIELCKEQGIEMKTVSDAIEKYAQPLP